MSNYEPRIPTITVMTCRDAQALFDVIQAAAHDRHRGMPPGIASVEDLKAVMRGGVAFFMAYKNTPGSPDMQPAGAVGYRWERGTLRVFHVAVLAQHRRGGVARRLLDAVEAVGLALGSTSVSMTVNDEAVHVAIFERHGYRPQEGGANPGRVQMGKAVGAQPA